MPSPPQRPGENPRNFRSSGQRSQSPPFGPAPSSRPATAPSCLTNGTVGTSDLWHRVSRSLTHSRSSGPGPAGSGSFSESHDPAPARRQIVGDGAIVT